jgi:DnaJ-class molecular chaperone
MGMLRRDAQVVVRQECHICHGTGEKPWSNGHTCYRCDGTGIEEVQVSLAELAEMLGTINRERQAEIK